MLGLAAPKQPGSKYGQAVAPNLAVKHECPNCHANPPNIIEEYAKGDLVCGDCGTILGDRVVDTRSEWRTFAGDEGDDPSRVGGASNGLLPNAQLETTIAFRDGKTGLSQSLLRAQTRGNHTLSNGKSSLAHLQSVFSRIAERCDSMQLGRGISEMAKHAYQIADEGKSLRGKNEAAAIAACIIFACRTGGADRSFQEVCKITRVSKKELGHVFTLVKAAVQKHQSNPENKNGPNFFAEGVGQASTRESAEGMVGRYVNYLDLGNVVLNAARYILARATEKSAIDGRSPVSIAAGVLYFTCVLFGKDVNTKQVSEIGKVSESTIKLICKMTASVIEQVTRPEWKTTYPEGYAALAALGRPTEQGRQKSRSVTPSTPTS